MSERKTNDLAFLPWQLLTIAFIVLKLCDVIDWSWWWVLLPTWGWVAFWIVVYTVLEIYVRRKKKSKPIGGNIPRGYKNHSEEICISKEQREKTAQMVQELKNKLWE